MVTVKQTPVNIHPTIRDSAPT